MSWQSEIAELLAYGRRIGLDFDTAWAEAVDCVVVPPMDARAPRALTTVIPGAEGQMVLEVEGGQSVLAFFKGVCRRSWEGVEVAPDGWDDRDFDGGGRAGHSRNRAAPV